MSEGAERYLELLGYHHPERLAVQERYVNDEVARWGLAPPPDVVARFATCKANGMDPKFNGTYPDASKVAGHKNPPPPGSGQ